MNELLQTYIDQIKKDLDINQLNISEVAKALPARRHHWAARLIEHRIKVAELERKRATIIKEVSSKIGAAAPVVLDKRNVIKAAEEHDSIQTLNEQISTNKIIVEFLEMVQKNFFSATYDVKNIIDIMKLEQL